MIRYLAVVALFVLACILAGAYGAFRNQVSYSVSPEYFTRFKFAQFNISPDVHNRLGASIVGWQASWWMGMIIGGFVIPFGLLLRDTAAFVSAVLRAFLVVAFTTLVFGIAALLISYVVIQQSPVEDWVFRGQAISNEAAFRRAGAMHNFSYIGGLLGIVTGMASILRSFLAENERLNIHQPSSDNHRMHAEDSSAQMHLDAHPLVPGDS